MADESIVGTGEGSFSWPDPLYQGLDGSGNSLWSFDKSGNLTVKGVVTSGSVSIGAGTAVNYGGNLAVNTNKFTVAFASGNTLVAGTLAVTGAATLSSTLACGALTVTGAQTISTTLGVAGASTLTGNVSCGGTLSVTGTSTQAAINASGTIAAAGAVTIGTTLAVTGASTLTGALASGALTVTGAASVSTTLGVTGASTLTGAVSCGGTLAVTGASTLAAVSCAALTYSGISFETGIETPITAHAGGTQAGALALNTSKPVHVVSTVGTAADSVKLPAASGSGACHTVSNQTATSLQLFGSGTDTINAVATATGIAVAAGKSAYCIDYAAGLWLAQLG
jgi:hypothetical protein